MTLRAEVTDGDCYKVVDLLYKFATLSHGTNKYIGLTDLVQFEIPLVPGTRPHFEPLRSHPRAYLNIVDEEVENMIEGRYCGTNKFLLEC